MTEFVYNNIKNLNSGQISFKLNCNYHIYIFYKNNIVYKSKFKLVDIIIAKLRELIIVYRDNQ